MTMVASVLTLLLFCSFVVVQCDYPPPIEDGIRCYTCKRVGNNEECNKEITQCSEGQVCRTDVNSKNNVIKITKRCRNTCRTTNQDFCNVAGTRCSYCCDKDLCNKELDYNNDEKNTTGEGKCPDMRGPRGPSGPMGQKGMKGDPGYPGHHGMDGLPGMTGIKGGPGRPGRPGADGDRGLPGDDGLPGLNGMDGRPGQPSSPGPKGEPGYPGHDGLPGRRGKPGAAGHKGERGDMGLTGDCACPNPATEVTRPEGVVFFGHVSGISQDNTNHVTLKIDTSVNLGHAYNTTSSVFTAPYRAAYLFSVHVICDGNKAVPLQLFKNEESVASSGRHDDNEIGTGAFYPVGIIQVILTLEVGDEVTLRVSPRGEGFWEQFKSFMASHSDVTYSGHMVGLA